MTQTFEDAGKFGKEFMDNGLKSLASFSKGVQAIAVESTEYAKKSFENGTSALEKLVAAKSLEKAIEAYSKVRAYPDSPYYDKALYKIAWTYYRLDRYDEAVCSFIELVDYADAQKAK